MASNTKAPFCGPCSINHKKSQSTRWCFECREGLCNDCLEHHKRMKMSRTHNTVDVEEYEKLPLYILNIKQDCAEHKHALELYCPVHQEPCCATCVRSDHSLCMGVTSLDSALENVKSSSAFQETERGLAVALQDLEKVQRSRKNNLNRIIEQDSLIKSDISALRKKINDHLDELEEEALQELQTVVSNETGKIKTVLNDLDSRYEDMVLLQKDLQGINLHATHLQTFYGMKHIEPILKGHLNFIQKLQTNESASDVDISFEQSKAVNLIAGRVSSFGQIKTSKSPTKSAHPAVRSKSMTSPRTRETTFKSGKTSLSQIPQSGNKEIDVRKMSLLYQRKINIPDEQTHFISCIIKLTNKSIIAANSSNKYGRLLLFNSYGRYIRDVKVKGNPWNIAQLDDSTIAVTYPDERLLKFINFVSDDVVDVLELNNQGRGLSNDHNAIYVGMSGNELRALDYYGNKLASTTVKSKMDNFHVTPDKIYFTDPKKHTLSGVSPQGKVIWTFKNEYMRGPQCVTMDKYGNFFVGCLDTDSIIAISADREKIKILLGKSAGIERPYAMNYDEENNILLISNKNGRFAAIYKIIYK